MRGEQVFREGTRVHQGTNHRHHTAALPDKPVIAELFHQRIPGVFILIQLFNVPRVQAKHRRRQRAAQGIFPLRRQHCLQHPQQFLRFRGFEYAVAVGKINRRNSQRIQRIANQRGFLAVTHQHGNV